MSYSVKQSIDFCKSLTKNHYENFIVASRLLSRRYRNAFYVIYAFCRWSDDLGDESDSPEKALLFLEEWETQLQKMFCRPNKKNIPKSYYLKRRNEKSFADDVNQIFVQNNSKELNNRKEECVTKKDFHPIIIALESIIQEFELPRQPFLDLLVAFRSDQQKQIFYSLKDLEEYCRFSANPVGRILLFLFLKTPTPIQLQYSDHICTALQWTNFWQDVRRDREKSRDYLPLDIQQQNDSFQDQIRKLVELTRQKFELGRPLLKILPRRFRFEISLFLEGGLAVLEKIEKIQYQTDIMRPVLNRKDKIRIFLRCLRLWIFNR